MKPSSLSRLLGLSKGESSVLAFLGENPDSSIAEISWQAKTPRMTVYSALSSLKKRGLISSARKGKRRIWSRISDADMKKAAMDLAKEFGSKKEFRVDVNDSGFAIRYGVRELQKTWESLLKLPAYARVQGIQPAASSRLAVEKLDWNKDVKHLNENIRKKPLILDGLLTDDYYDLILRPYAGDRKMQRKMLESFTGRVTDMTYISKEYFQDSATELIMLPNVAYLSDWRNEVSLEIRNEMLLGFLKELYQLAKGYGKKVDQNLYIEKLIADMDKKP